MKPIVQVSLDLTDINEALEMAHIAMRAGVDWLEAGTPFIIAEGMHGVRALRAEFPKTPIVADLKTMDGGFLEAQMMAQAGATIIAIDSRSEALELASSLGANYTFKVGDEIQSKVKDLTGGYGAEVVLDFVGNEQTVALGASICRALGDFTIVGIAGGVLPFSFFSIPYETSLQTTYWGSRAELAEVLDLAAHHLISPKISKFKLADAPLVYLDLAAGKIEGRAVIVP